MTCHGLIASSSGEGGSIVRNADDKGAAVFGEAAAELRLRR
jgi:hypothetical protein